MTRVYMAGAVGRPRTAGLLIDRRRSCRQSCRPVGRINSANMRKVQVIRLVNGREQSQVLDLRPTLAGHPTQPFYVRDGDVVSIPQSAF